MNILVVNPSERKGHTIEPGTLDCRSKGPESERIDTLAIALKYLSQGISVLPQVPGKKHTFVRWKPFQNRLPTAVEVEGWFKSWPQAGIAAALGPVSNLFVIDVDSPEAHEALLSRLGQEPRAPKVLSGSREPLRYHLFFRHPNVATLPKYTPWHPQLEFRGQRGLIVLPPSLHKSGNPYVWAPGQSFEEVPLGEVPEEVMKALEERVANQAHVNHQPAELPAIQDLDQVQSRARIYLAKIPPAIEGQNGDKQTFTAACKLVHGFGLPVEDALPIMLDYNRRCQPPWAEAELLHKLREAERMPGPRGTLLSRNRSTRTTASNGGNGEPSALDEQLGKTPFFGNVPDFIQVDWNRARPHCTRHPGEIGRPRLSKAGLVSAIHLAVIYQGRSRVVVADKQLAQAIWGAEDWPANWRQIILHKLQPLCRPEASQLVKVEDLGRTQAVDACPKQCAMHGTGIRHGHLAITIKTESNVAEGFLGCLDVYGFDDNSNERAYMWKRNPKPCQSEENLEDDEREARQAEVETLAVIKKLKSAGTIWSVYLPTLLFGSCPKLGMTNRQRRLHRAITRELTRCLKSKKSNRPDRAEIVVGSQMAADADSFAKAPCPFLEPDARYVGFNGNASYRRQHLRGNGYRLTTWINHAAYYEEAADDEDTDPRLVQTSFNPWDTAKEFLRDLEALSDFFGLVVAAWHPQRQEWRDLHSMRSMIRSAEGRKWLDRCVVRIYTTDDYLVRWRREFAKRMGFSAIPDVKREEPAATTQAGSPAQLNAFLKKHGMTGKQFAKELNVSPGLVSQRLSGKRSWNEAWQRRVDNWIGRQSAKVGSEG